MRDSRNLPTTFIMLWKISRARNLLAKFREFCVHKVIASHSRKPKIRDMSPKFSKLDEGGAELKDKTLRN